MLPAVIGAAASLGSAAIKSPGVVTPPPAANFGHTSVNIQPGGINLGAIVQPFIEGAPGNGGSGLNMASRFLNRLNMTDGAVSLKPSRDTTADYFMIGSVVAFTALILYINKRKRG